MIGLQKFGHPELPSDSRTLCNTPNRINIQALVGGTYAHYGLEKALKEQLQYVLLQCSLDMRIFVTLKININIDALPLSKSSKSQLWPILDKIVGTQNQFIKQFFIGAFHGNSKPFSVVTYLQIFIAKYTKFNSVKGLYMKIDIILYNLMQILPNAILADTPARNFISYFPAHNSRCGKYIQFGETTQIYKLKSI